jgi:hypothetical protein
MTDFENIWRGDFTARRAAADLLLVLALAPSRSERGVFANVFSFGEQRELFFLGPWAKCGLEGFGFDS